MMIDDNDDGVMDLTVFELQDLIKKVLTENQLEIRSTEMLDEEVVQALLREESNLTTESANIFEFSSLIGTKHYPLHPLYKEIACKLFKWIETSCHPAESLQRFELLEQTSIKLTSKREALGKAEEILYGLKNSWKKWEIKERKKHVRECLGILDKRMLLDLLGVRHTVGSVDLFPPPVGELVNSFCKNHKPSSKLSVGARALSKHCHRDSSSMFWGMCTGTEDAKNKHACMILHQILNDAAWINVHLLPHDVKVIEVRCSQGYGARWLHDGSEFRGFLEPQMMDGHAMKWRH